MVFVIAIKFACNMLLFFAILFVFFVNDQTFIFPFAFFFIKLVDLEFVSFIFSFFQVIPVIENRIICLTFLLHVTYFIVILVLFRQTCYNDCYLL